MRRKAILIVASSCAIALSVSLASAAVRTTFPAQNPGPPYYAFFAGAPFAEIFRDGGWRTVRRSPECSGLETARSSGEKQQDHTARRLPGPAVAD
jgi:hypothetical protein